MKFFFSGKSIEVATEQPGIKKVRDFLDQVKDGELLSTLQVTAGAGISFTTINTANYAQSLGDYHYIYGHKRYWGNKKTVKALERKDHEQRKRGN